MDKYSLQKHTHLVSFIHIYRRAGWHIYNHSSMLCSLVPCSQHTHGEPSRTCISLDHKWSNRHLLVSSGFLESAKNLVRHVHLLHCHLLLLLWRLSWKIVVRSTCFIMFLYSPSSPPSSSSSSSSSEMSISSGLSADCISCTALLCSSPRTNMMFEPTAGKGKTCLISCF